MDVSAAYDQEFFEMHAPWRAEYDLIADALARLLQFSTALDLGCGCGFIIARLAALGKVVRGVDGSRAALDSVPPEVRGRVELGDLAAPLSLGASDLVICSEVAEHLDARHADALVENVCRHASSHVFFTAATPGQGGLHHVNEQPHDYWIEKFGRRGFALDAALTARLRGELAAALRTAWWFTNNAMIFRAPDGGAAGPGGGV